MTSWDACEFRGSSGLSSSTQCTPTSGALCLTQVNHVTQSIDPLNSYGPAPPRPQRPPRPFSSPAAMWFGSDSLFCLFPVDFFCFPKAIAVSFWRLMRCGCGLGVEGPGAVCWGAESVEPSRDGALWHKVLGSSKKSVQFLRDPG